jgi:hypothetical protein
MTVKMSRQGLLFLEWVERRRGRIAIATIVTLVAAIEIFGHGNFSSPKSSGPTTSLPTAEMKTVTAEVAPGCRSIEDADKILHMTLAQDYEAVGRLMRKHILKDAAEAAATDTCRWFHQGERLFVDKRAFNDATCMMPRGETECYWINEGYMR